MTDVAPVRRALPWTSDEPVPDVRALTLTGLLEVWSANRNGVIGLVASSEVCRRLTETRRAEPKESDV